MVSLEPRCPRSVTRYRHGHGCDSREPGIPAPRWVSATQALPINKSVFPCKICAVEYVDRRGPRCPEARWWQSRQPQLRKFEHPKEKPSAVKGTRNASLRVAYFSPLIHSTPELDGGEGIVTGVEEDIRAQKMWIAAKR